jgi:putative restriction endonuclease
MLQTFDELNEKAETGEKSAVRALQAWQFLIGKARNRQIVQYEELRQLLGYPTCNPLRHVLGCIMWFCQQNPPLPPLTIIVVNQSGEPGDGFSAEIRENYHQRREDVFNYPWFNLVPPTIHDFIGARLQA